MSISRDISSKANRVLNIILLCLLLIFLRVWHLAITQREAHLVQAYRPQRRTTIESVERGTIRDRFGIPMALNKLQYHAAICYADIRQVPSIVWKKDENGKSVRTQARVAHISALSQLLAKELYLDPVQIEDTIYGKASLFPHTPFILKGNITEQTYYRLKALEKDWPGLQVQRSARRFYPLGKVGCDVLGYLGAIGQKEYLEIANEIQELEAYVVAREQNQSPFLPKGFHTPMQVRERLAQLHEKAYTINDVVGKTGVEAFYETDLRGFHGKKIFEVDTKGSIIRELPGTRATVEGKQLTLAISAELQEYAETLLAANEGASLSDLRLDEKWMRGGAVVAMIPKTGEVVAMASYPRFDPNDFIPTYDATLKKKQEVDICKWLENETYMGEIWDGKRPLEREYFSFPKGAYQTENLHLTWNCFLETVLPSSGSLLPTMRRFTTIKEAIEVQWLGLEHIAIQAVALNHDKQLLIDLCRLGVEPKHFSPQLLESMGSQTLEEYHTLRQAVMRLEQKLKNKLQEIYHDNDFTLWRRTHFKEFLKEKRSEEKKQKRYARPYTDYLDQVEKKLFQAFWKAYRLIFLHTVVTGAPPVDIENYPHLHLYIAFLKSSRSEHFSLDNTLYDLETVFHKLNNTQGLAYLNSMRSFEDLAEPLLGHYLRVRHIKGVQLQKHLASAFYPIAGYGYGRSQSFRQSHALGSVFKLVTAYQGLLERYQEGAKDLNPLTIIDDLKGSRLSTSNSQILGYMLDGKPILRSYKGGLLPRSSYSKMGLIDITGALEQSSNVYFALLAGDHLRDPEEFAETARHFSFGERTGIDLTGESKGNIPTDLTQNRTGLYSFSIGQHTLLATPLQTASMLSTLGNRGEVVKPKVVKKLSGLEPAREEEILFSAPTFPYQDTLSLVGIHFPLFTGARLDHQKGSIDNRPIEIQRSLFIPPEIHRILTLGMEKVVLGSKGSARPSLMRDLYHHPQALIDYNELKRDLIAKTGTAQIRYKQSLDAETPADMKQLIWFGALAYPPGSDHLQAEPELAVVVLLRYGKAGRDAAPLTAQIVKKWRELNAKYAKVETH
jgi:cell division protein FtsI/penicillin-binding protein 2